MPRRHKRRVIEADIHPELATERPRERWTLAQLHAQVMVHVKARSRAKTAQHYQNAYDAITAVWSTSPWSPACASVNCSV